MTVNIKFTMPIFQQYLAPEGFLVRDKACHALFYYYLIAHNTYETHIKDVIVYEGDPDPQYNFKQMFSSAAACYGVQPEQMVQFWRNVDMQCDLLGLPILPDEERFRFNRTPELKTQ